MSTSIALRHNDYFLLRYKPTGELFGKHGRDQPGPLSLFTDEKATKAGLTWIRKGIWPRLADGLVASLTLPTDWEIVKVDVQLSVQ